MIRIILIPKNRIPILVGKEGAVKKVVEEKTRTKIVIGDEVTIEGEPLDVLTAENIIKAIGRGFSPQTAMELLNEDLILEIIQLPENKKTLKRIKSRIIGTAGKTRRNIERLTKTKLSVYGRTVAIIGTYNDTEAARQSIEKLMEGSTHRNVYRFLELRKNG
jgi:ribosomal RNA assembly protein